MYNNEYQLMCTKQNVPGNRVTGNFRILGSEYGTCIM